MRIAEEKTQPELLENLIYLQEQSLLTEFWIPRYRSSNEMDQGKKPLHPK